MIACMFPGQGSQAVGMGKALAEAFPIVRETMAEADEALGESLSGLCFEGPAEKLVLTENTQPAILAVSVAFYRLLASTGVVPALRRRALARRVLGARRGRDDDVCRRAADRAPPRALHAGSRAGGAGRDGGDPRARRREGGAGLRRGRAGRRGQPREPERAGPGGHRRVEGRGGAGVERARSSSAPSARSRCR